MDTCHVEVVIMYWNPDWSLTVMSGWIKQVAVQLKWSQIVLVTTGLVYAAGSRWSSLLLSKWLKSS